MVDYTSQDFNIVSTPIGQNIDACAFFKFKGYEISMTTAGRSKGACLNEVCVFKNREDRDPVFKGHTVEECIDWIISN